MLTVVRRSFATSYRLDGIVGDEELFVIDDESGQISVGEDVLLNFENAINDEYMVTVMAVDPGNAGSTVVVTITVLNVNESPKFVEDTNNQNLESKDVSETETDPAMRFISGYMATDDENAAPPTVDLEWSLSGQDADKFDFYDSQSCANVEDNTTGASVNICLKAIPDFEARGDANGDNIYSISVDAKDSDDNTTSRNVAVTIRKRGRGRDS